ncbi:MAG: hypothetical protein ACK4XK_12555, partial [Casimicrobiaceae bacterium]
LEMHNAVQDFVPDCADRAMDMPRLPAPVAMRTDQSGAAVEAHAMRGLILRGGAIIATAAKRTQKSVMLDMPSM